MNTLHDLYRGRQGHSPSACAPAPVRCNTCGMLECLCRPRFFAGQVLTADDLNRLDGYIRGKQRLHNRQLHGWGVVNGLEVTCNPCGDGVAVGCGYALSPCGEDILVCEAVTVDVCDLVRRCKDAERHWQTCDPPRPPPRHDCDAGEEEWVLAIRYAESPTRGVKPLRPAQDCGCAPGTKTPVAPRGAPVQCEPTVVCEGFAFEVYRKPPESDPGNDDRKRDLFNPQSELYQRFRCCASLLLDGMPPLPGPLSFAQVQANPQAWYQWMNAARGQLARYLATHGATNCELLARFNAVPYPGAGTPQNAAAIFLAVVLLLIVWLDTLFSCFCSALLPPCPAPADSTLVPIASLHLGGGPCRVLRICNWSEHRKIAVSVPALQYWLGLLPFGTNLRRGLERLCCLDLSALLRDTGTPGAATTPDIVGTPGVPGTATPAATANALAAATAVNGANQDPNLQRAAAAYQQANDGLNPQAAEPRQLHGAFEVLSNALGRSNETLEFSTLVEGMLRSADPADPAGTKTGLAGAETANLPQFLIANQLLRPLAAATLGPLAGLLTGRDDAQDVAAPAAPAAASAAGLAELRAELAELRTGLAAQAAELAQLKAAGGATGTRRGSS